MAIRNRRASSENASSQPAEDMSGNYSPEQFSNPGPVGPLRMKRFFSAMRKLSTRRNLTILLFAVLLVGFVYYFSQYQKLSKSSTQISKEKTEALLKEVSKVAILPNDPNVQVATVTDINKLKGQAFFSTAQNGDVILIFPTAKEAILYRPSIRKIVSISQLSSTQPTGQVFSTSTKEALSSFKKNATTSATNSTTSKAR